MGSETTEEQKLDREISSWIQERINGGIEKALTVCALGVNIEDSTTVPDPFLPLGAPSQRTLAHLVQQICTQTTELLACLGIEVTDDIPRLCTLAFLAPEGWGTIERVQKWALFTFGKPLEIESREQLHKKVESQAAKYKEFLPHQRRAYVEYHTAKIEELSQLSHEQQRQKLEYRAKAIMSVVEKKYKRHLSNE